MPIDTLPGEIVVKSRDRVKADYLRSYKLRNPDADTSPGTQPDIDAATMADQMVPVYANAQTTGRNILLKNATGSKLDEIGEAEGRPRRLAVGATGFVIATAAATGGTIFEGDEITEPNSQLRYECALTKLYADGELVPVRGVDTGSATNLPAGTVLQWSAPRPGIGPSAAVFEQSNGEGLSGGAETEDDDTYRAGIIEHRSNPPASGNDAEYQLAVLETPGLQIEKPFTYPAIKGAGTMGIVFTTRPQTVSGSRLPTATQVSAVTAYITGRMPGDDSIFVGSLLGQPLDIALEVEWAEGAAGWSDVAPWPPRYDVAGSPGKVIATAVTDATHFTLGTTNGDYTGIAQPAAGNTIGFYDSGTRTFSRKRILSATGAGPWVIVCDTDENASDTSYTPAVGQPACPWSDSLDALVAPVRAYVGKLGPGEQVASFFDAGARQRRNPRPPREWPSIVSNRLLDGVFDLAEIQDADLAEGAGTAPPVGTPGVVSYLLELRYLTAFEI